MHSSELGAWQDLRPEVFCCAKGMQHLVIVMDAKMSHTVNETEGNGSMMQRAVHSEDWSAEGVTGFATLADHGDVSHDGV